MSKTVKNGDKIIKQFESYTKLYRSAIKWDYDSIAEILIATNSSPLIQQHNQPLNGILAVLIFRFTVILFNYNIFISMYARCVYNWYMMRS